MVWCMLTTQPPPHHTPHHQVTSQTVQLPPPLALRGCAAHGRPGPAAAVEALQTTVGTVGTLRSAASEPGAEGPLTLRLNATAAEAEPPGPDAALALGDYLDAALARLGGTADRAVQAVVELNHGEDAPDGLPSEASPATLDDPG